MAEIKDFNRNQYLLKAGKNKSEKKDETDRDKDSMNSMLARHRQFFLCWQQWQWWQSYPILDGKIRYTQIMRLYSRMCGNGHQRRKA